MANVTISQLPSAADLTGSEEIPVVQDGSTVKTTAQAIADLGGGGGLGSIDIQSDGLIGGPSVWQAVVGTVVPSGTTGNVTLSSNLVPNITIGGNGQGSITATFINFPTLVTANVLQVGYNSTVQTISSPTLTTLASNLDIQNNSALTTVDFPLLQSVDYIYFGQTPLLSTINLSSLVKAGQLYLSSSNSNITGFRQSTFPALRNVGINVGYYYTPGFVIDLPLVTDLTGLSGSFSSSNTTSINMPGLVNICTNTNNSPYITYATSLTHFILGTPGVTKQWGIATQSTYISLYNNAFDQASVDNIFEVLASLDGTNGTVRNSNGNLSMSGQYMASPSPAGAAARNTLISRGWYVASN
jgi:hypothetical protein